ncbi:hypothetical protein MXD62_22190 [Frankia sp. Mgl5]|uniref:hypothetical protein n=1 Tax=Frankia sp. Mgl5 TaxID=2933793 RepID=UPI00200D8D8A|nr:hypothetical protein [Frankia sp. Mgl5]MCK9929847.1 hypothetical protein [Frankia sp. Mgl5]
MAGGVGAGRFHRSTRPAPPGRPASEPNRPGAVLILVRIQAQVLVHVPVMALVSVSVS